MKARNEEEKAGVKMRPGTQVQRVDSLCEAWCGRRYLTALQHLPRAWPLISHLTDARAELGIALQNVRALGTKLRNWNLQKWSN